MPFPDDVIHRDPESPSLVISARSAAARRDKYAAITFTRDARIGPRSRSIGGFSLPVCVPPDQVLPVLTKLGDKLRGERPESDDRTVVTTLRQLEAFRDLVASKYRDPQMAKFIIGDLIDLLTDSVNTNYSAEERSGVVASSV